MREGANHARYLSNRRKPRQQVPHVSIRTASPIPSQRLNKTLPRAARYRQIQAVLQADLPYVPLWYEDSLVVHGPRVLGYDTDLHGQFDGLINVNRVATNVRQAP